MQALVLGKVDPVEEHLRSVFKTEIGANTVDAADSIKEGVTFNHHKGVFQAALKIDDQVAVFAESRSHCSRSETEVEIAIYIYMCVCV